MMYHRKISSGPSGLMPFASLVCATLFFSLGVSILAQENSIRGPTESNCSSWNFDLFPLFNFLSGGVATIPVVDPKNVDSDAIVIPESIPSWTLSDLCSLNGVTCLRRCQNSTVDLLRKQCPKGIHGKNLTLENPTLYAAECVRDLNLGNRGLEGDLQSLAPLTSLVRLNLSSNAVWGKVSALSDMLWLQRVDLSNNGLSGTLDGAENWQQMRHFTAPNNFLSGDISHLSNLSKLAYLDLHNNYFNDTIDPLRNMKGLEFVYLNENYFTGHIDAIGHLDQLVLASLTNNSFSGKLPDRHSIPNLVALMIGGNNFTEVGGALRAMPNLQFADLSRNNFSDNINSVLVSIGTWMGALALEKNNFEGRLASDPEITDNLPNLEIFSLSDNPLVTGVMSPNLLQFQQIQVHTNDQFLYYMVDASIFKSIETVRSTYFKIQEQWLSEDPLCRVHSMSVYANDTLQKIEIPEETQSLYFCFVAPRGKFLINRELNSLMPFNASYFYTVNSCGQKSDKQGDYIRGHLFGSEQRTITITVPVTSCEKKNNRITMSVYTFGTYADGYNRGYINDYYFEVKRTMDANDPSIISPFIAAIVMVALFIIALAAIVWTAITLYRSYQQQILFLNLKRKAEAGFINARRQLQISTDTDTCVVFTDLQSSTVLRSTSSQLYNDIILLHDGTVRKLLRQHGGLELATEGDGFVLWFESVASGALFCMELQQELLDVSWSPAVKKLCKSAYGIGNSSIPDRLKVLLLMGDSTTLSCSQKIHRWAVQGLQYLKRHSGDKCFSGPRVRCGVHVLKSGCNIIEKVSLGVYSFSGPDVEKGRVICDIGNGGQILVSSEAQAVILESLNAAHFPMIWHWGGYAFDDEDEDPEVHHIYEIAPSQGIIKLRTFTGLRGNIRRVIDPGLQCMTIDPPRRNVVIVCAAAKDVNISQIACSIADDLFFEMQERFWGWRLFPDTDVKAFTECNSFSALNVILNRAPSRDSSGDHKKQLLNPNQDGVWYFAFGKPEDALRFALCCQLELAYAQWPGKVANKYKKVFTADKAPLWCGLPVAFAIHLCPLPDVLLSAQADNPSGAESTISIWKHTKSISKDSTFKLELCNPSRKNVLYASADALRQTWNILKECTCNGQVVTTGEFLQSMTVPLSHVGGPIVEQLGKVTLDTFDDPVYLYQMLPVELAARSFPLLSEVLKRGQLISPGARMAPPAKPGLTFVFTYTLKTNNGNGNDRKQGAHLMNQTFCAESLFNNTLLQNILNRYGGYLVDESGIGNMVLAFDSLNGAVCFCGSIQKALNIRKRSMKSSDGDSWLDATDLETQMLFDDEEDDHFSDGRHIKMGIAAVDSMSMRDVFEGIDTTTGRRRYSTPVLNMASRVAKSAHPGQILLVGKFNVNTLLSDKTKYGKEARRLLLIKRGYYTLKGFGRKARLITEVRDPKVQDASLDFDLKESTISKTTNSKEEEEEPAVVKSYTLNFKHSIIK